jgi:hypothetical protein
MKTILKLILIFAVLAVTFSSCVVRERVYGPHYPAHYTTVYYH